MSTERLAIGLDVGGTKIAGGLVDPASGAVHDKVVVPTCAEHGSDAVLGTAADLVRSLAESIVDRRSGVAVGVGVPELVDPDGRITSSYLLAWSREQVASTLARAVQPVPCVVRIEADVRAAALAEARFGAGRGHETFCYVTVGTGISCCLVQHGVPYTGARGNALILVSPTHRTRRDSASPGDDGPDLLETVAAGPALVERYAELTNVRLPDARAVLSAAHAGDQPAMQVVRDAGEALGEALAHLVNALDPAAVVVGGGLGSAGGLYVQAAIQRARDLIWAPATRSLPIVRAELGADAGLVGAGLVAVAGPNDVTKSGP
ncbi:MAG TPA: ROK family protein [Actinopolymorphaceae bacterium]|jgi:glucokinase